MEKENYNGYQFGGTINNLSAYNYPQFSPYYRPNPAFNTGLAFGSDANMGAKVGTTADLLFQSLFNFSNKLQPFLQDTKLYKSPDHLRREQMQGGQDNQATAVNPTLPPTREQMQRPKFQLGGLMGANIGANVGNLYNPFDPTPLAPNEIDLKPSDTNPRYNPYPQQQVPQLRTDSMGTVMGEELATESPNQGIGAANIVGASAAATSFALDLGKNIAGGIGVGRRSAYAYDRAQEKMREATINQGFEKGREDLFNQGYLQTTGFLAQNGGQTPIVVSNPNDPRLQAYQDSLALHNKFIFSEDEKNARGIIGDKMYPIDYKLNSQEEMEQFNLWYGISKKNEIKPTAQYNSDFLEPYFKKPTQPVIYKPLPEPIKNVSVVDPLNTSTGNQNLSKIDMDTKMKNPNSTKQSKDYPGYEEVIGPDVNGITKIIGYKNKQTGAYTPKYQDGGEVPTMLPSEQEVKFQEWYSQYAAMTGGTPNPYDPTLTTDYKSKFINSGGKLPNGETIFQEGGTQPIVVTDPNDPRLQAYQDSLTVFNLLNERDNYFKKIGNFIPGNTIDEWYNNLVKAELEFKNNSGYTDAEERLFSLNKEYPKTKETERLVTRTFENEGKRVNIYGSKAEKPTQPVIYQKPVVADDKSFTKTKTPIINTPNPRPKQEPIKNVSVVDPLNNQSNNQTPEKLNIDTSIKPKETYTAGYLPSGYVALYEKGSNEQIGWKRDGKFYPLGTNVRNAPYQDGGAIPVSMNGLKEYPKQEVIVPSNNITMEGIGYDVLAVPNNDPPQLMQPNKQYSFPNSTQVLEKPMLKNGGMIKLEDGVYFDPTTQDFIIENTNNFQNGGSVSELYTSITGNSWNQAKIEGLTDGSYDKNMKLRSELLNSPESFSKKKIENQPIKNNNIEKASNFAEAFNIARNTLGPNNIFEYNGKKYGTNIKGESFNPDKEILDKFNLNSKETNKRLEEQNKLVKSPFSTKSTVKVEPTYEDWEVVRERNKDLNKLPQIDIIKNYNKNNNSEYLILDKSKGKMHLFRGDKEIKSYNVGIGQNKGDEQTKTVIRDAKVQWDEGNKKTGAGIYTVSNVNENNKQFNNSPSWIFKNEDGIEVPMVIHGAFGDRVKKISDDDPSNDRVSNGCINGLCYDLKELYNEGFGLNETLYVLAEDEGNKFEVSNGKLVFKSASSDVNKTVKTLNYKPIKVSVNKDNFAKDVFQWNDFNDEEEYDKVVLPYVAALQDYKQDIMKVAKINGDVYNDIVKISFGILGTESNFGDTHSAIGNFTRAVNKFLDPKNNSSPDYVSKSTTYGANKESNSVGLTQIRFNQLDAQELKALKTFGISTPEQLLTPKNAAIATAVILGIRYNNQLTPIEKENLLETLPTKWNNRDNYSDRVNSNSRYLTIKELN